MIELVFSDSAAGGMKIAKTIRKGGASRGAARAWRGSGDEAGDRNGAYEPEGLPGSPGDIAKLHLALEIGDLSGLPDIESRREQVFEMLAGPYGDPGRRDHLDRFWEYNAEGFRRLKEAGETGEAVRIWWSDAPGETCGFSFALSLLKDAPCPVTSVKLPHYLPRGRDVVLFDSIGSMPPEELVRIAALEQPVDAAVRRGTAMEWETLAKENAPLRAVVNGSLLSVPEDFYDGLLRAGMPEGDFKIVLLIGRVLGKLPGVGDWWLYQRIKKMLQTGELEMVEPAKSGYDAVVRKAK
jgi:hypothetical protein